MTDRGRRVSTQAKLIFWKEVEYVTLNKMNFLKNEAVVIGIILTLFTASVLIGVSQQIQSKSKNGDSLLKSPKKIGLIYLYGPISMDGAPSAFSPNTAESVIETISEFTKNNTIQALIIRVNSPGGTVGASQELYSEIIRFKKEIPRFFWFFNYPFELILGRSYH